MSVLLNKKWARLYLVSLSALLTGLAVCFPDTVGGLAYVSMIPALLVLLHLSQSGAKLRHAYLYGLLYFEIYFSVCFHWFVYLYPLDFTGINNFNSVLVIITATFGLSLLQALGSALVFLLVAALARLSVFERHRWLYLPVIPSLYAIFEYQQTIGWWGVPWGRLVLSQMYDPSMVFTSSLFGTYFVSAVIVLVNLGAAAFLYYHPSAMRFARSSALAAILAISLNMSVGTFLYRAEQVDSRSDETVKIALIQSNYSATDTNIYAPLEMLETHFRLSEQAAAEGASVMLWPESTLPYHFTPDNYLGVEVSRFAKEQGVSIIIGALTYAPDGFYNRMYLINPDGTYSDVEYDKRHLVPFGEYVPMRDVISAVLPFLADISILSDDMTPGVTADVFVLDDGSRAGALICFDSIYEALARDTVKAGAQYFVLGTNDSWFSDSAAIYMHNNQARLRSIEFGRATARCAVTGTCTAITSAGDVTVSTEPLTECYAVAEIGISDDTTLYTIIGNLFIHLCTAFDLGVFAYGIAITIKKRRSLNDGQNTTENSIFKAD